MLQKFKEQIEKSLKHLEGEFGKLQVGRANPAIVEGIFVEQYGSLQQLKNVASVGLLDSQTINIQPWDRNLIHPIAKAITNENLGLNPQTMADSVIIKIPPLTQEKRQETVKIAKRMLEEGKVGIRNVRQDAQKFIKQAEDKGEITEDDLKRLEKELQKIIDDANAKAEELFEKKEKEIMKI